MAKKMSKGTYTAGAPTTGAKAKDNVIGKRDVSKGGAVSTGKSMVKPKAMRSPTKSLAPGKGA